MNNKIYWVRKSLSPLISGVILAVSPLIFIFIIFPFLEAARGWFPGDSGDLFIFILFSLPLFWCSSRLMSMVDALEKPSLTDHLRRNVFAYLVLFFQSIG